jgi:CubicO group peptidase (beta-lactamase class C family)
MRAEVLSKLQREVQARYRSISAFLVVRRGYLAFESYYGAVGQDDKHLVASVTKSFVSALIGIAINRGHIEGVQQRVLGFFPEYAPGPRDHLKRQMTIQHLLTMTAGFRWRTGPRNHELYIDRLRRSKDWIAFILDLPVRERLFGAFQYCSAASHLLSAIITRSTGMCAEEFAAARLFAPIGIDLPAPHVQHTYSQEDVLQNKGGGWPRDPQGNSIGGWGLALKPRDMARFGYLYLNGGQWEGKHMIPRQWVEDSISAHTPGYGYQWWLRDVNGVFAFSAVGQGGQHIFCLPEHDLVVAVTSRLGSRWRDRWPLLEEFVIPAVVR